MLSRFVAPCGSKLSLPFLRHFAIKVSSLKKQSLVTQLLRGDGSPKLTTFTLKGSSNAIHRAEASLSPAYRHDSPDASVELPVPKSGSRQQEQHFSSNDARIDKLPSRSKKQRKEAQLRDVASNLSARERSKKDYHIDVNTQLPVTSEFSVPSLRECSKAYHEVGETKSCVGAQSGSKRVIYIDGKLVHKKNKKVDPEKVSVQPQRTREENDGSYVLAESKPGSLALQTHRPSQESRLHISNSSVFVECRKKASMFLARNRWIIQKSVEQRPQGLQVLGEFEVDLAARVRLFNTNGNGIDWSNCRSVLSFLNELGLSAESRNRMIHTWPSIVKVPVESAMQPTVDFFDSMKLDRPILLKAVESYPRTFCLLDDKHLMAMYELFQHVGLSAREFLKTMSRMPAACPPVDFFSQHKYFRELGLSDEAFVSMVQRNPRLVVLKLKSLKPKLDFLLHTAKWDIWEVVLFPAYFNYSLKARIIPRFEILKAANLLKRPALCTMLERTELNLEYLLTAFGSLEG